MKNNLLLLTFIATTLISCNSSNDKEEWTSLFNGKDLSQWDTYLGPKMTEGDSGNTVRSEQFLGLNNDTAGVFSLAELDGEKVLRVSGEIWGGISTKKEYSNYHLQLKFKWGEKKWFPRGKDSDKRDSGLLYHGVGKHGADYGYWMRSQEFQIQEGDCGDYWGVAGALEDVPSSMNPDSTFSYDPKGELREFSSSSPYGRNCKKFPDAEKPTGEWNTLDLYCFGDSSVHVVNGVVTMQLFNSRQQDETVTPLKKGKIQIQSESAEVFYKDIKIQSIGSFPKLD